MAKQAAASISARPIKNVEAAHDPSSGRFALRITDTAESALSVSMTALEAAQLIGYVLSTAAAASGPRLAPGSSAQVEALHPSDFGFGPGASASETRFWFQVGPIQFALSVPTSKWAEMCGRLPPSPGPSGPGNAQPH